jgi:diguanylate cyclase (GGDEF)-like protein/PAS domain S-box-containing protein
MVSYLMSQIAYASRAEQSWLLIEPNVAHATKFIESLGEPDHPQVEWVKCLSDGLSRLNTPGLAAILVNLFLPDSEGIDTFYKVRAVAGSTPIMVLCGARDERVGRLAVQHGADDLLLNDNFDAGLLSRMVSATINRHAKDVALFVGREQTEFTLNSIGDAVLATDLAGNVTYLNTVAESMTGWSRAEAVGRPFAEIFNTIDGTTRQQSDNPMALAVHEDKTVRLPPNCILVHRDGRESPVEDSTAPIHDRAGRTTGAVIVFHDVSTAVQLAQQLSHLAQHDVLTDLPNRILFDDRLQQAILLAQRHEYRVGVLFLDLDRFKHVNDSLGHVIGDRLLQGVAKRLRCNVRRSDTVGRRGGDEFAVLLSELDTREDAGRSAEKLLAALTVPYQISPHVLHVPASMGLSIYPDDGQDAETLMNNADTAMYHAKQNGRANFKYFKQEMTAGAVERQFIEGSLEAALERHQFSLHYQPKIGLGTGAIVGVEALLRWWHPERGFIPPDQFVPIAEDTGMILPIGRWVLGEVCRQSRAWLDDGRPLLPIAVNISALEFRADRFVDTIRELLDTSRLEPQGLELELTESVLMKDGESTIAILQSLKTIGVRLAVDDFGTGYSSLSYLRQFPIDSLKVDRSFVRGILTKSDDAVIVRAVINMGNSMNKRVIAEGVETRDQLDFLTAAGCEEAQGFYFHRPMTAAEFVALL